MAGDRRDEVPDPPEQPPDPAEVWGRRIGRTAGWIAVVALVVWFAFRYLPA